MRIPVKPDRERLPEEGGGERPAFRESHGVRHTGFIEVDACGHAWSRAFEARRDR